MLRAGNFNRNVPIDELIEAITQNLFEELRQPRKVEIIHCFSQIKLNSLVVKNRFVMPPMNTNMADSTGGVTDKQIDYYEERARNNVGLIIFEATSVTKGVRNMLNQPEISGDEFIPRFNDLVERIHFAGAKIALQLMHPGRQALLGALVGPSSVSTRLLGGNVKTLSITDIEQLVDQFAKAALRAKNAGFDAIEIHGAHGYLINQFISRLSNERTDIYGGTLENRLRFPLEIIERVRGAVGPRFPILFRLSGKEYLEGGIDEEETIKIATRLEGAGIDAIDISSGTYDSLRYMVTDDSLAPGHLVPLAANIKKAVNIPVIVVGKLHDPSYCESILKDNQADMIALGRALLSDPAFITKVKDRCIHDIRPCIACCKCLTERIFIGKSVKCAVNPEVGSEKFSAAFRLTGDRKKVLVVGAGPAGMVSSIYLAKNGHDVTLVDSNSDLGGKLNIIEKLPHKIRIRNYLNWLRCEVKNNKNIKIVLNEFVDEDTVSSISPDAVVLATGSKPVELDIPPSSLVNAVRYDDFFKKWDAKAEEGDFVIVGGGPTGCVIAEYIISKFSVTSKDKPNIWIIDMDNVIAKHMEPISREVLIDELLRHKVTFRLSTRVTGFEDDKIVLESIESPKCEKIRAGLVIYAIGETQNNILEEYLDKTSIQSFSVGDSKDPKDILQAVSDGFQVAQFI